MLYRLGVTGCGSRVALSEMLRGFAESFAKLLCRLKTFFGRARIGPTSRYAVTAVELCRLRAWPEVGGGGASRWTCLLRFFMSFLAPPGARAEPDLDGRCFYPTGRGLRLPSRRQVACAEPELDGCFHYPTG